MVKRLEMQIDHLNEQIKKSAETNQAVNMEEVNNYDLNQSILSQAPKDDEEKNDLEDAGDLNFIDHAGFFNNQEQMSHRDSFVSQRDLQLHGEFKSSFNQSDIHNIEDNMNNTSYVVEQTECDLIGV